VNAKTKRHSKGTKREKKSKNKRGEGKGFFYLILARLTIQGEFLFMKKIHFNHQEKKGKTEEEGNIYTKPTLMVIEEGKICANAEKKREEDLTKNGEQKRGWHDFI